MVYQSVGGHWVILDGALFIGKQQVELPSLRKFLKNNPGYVKLDITIRKYLENFGRWLPRPEMEGLNKDTNLEEISETRVLVIFHNNLPLYIRMDGPNYEVVSFQYGLRSHIEGPIEWISKFIPEDWERSAFLVNVEPKTFEPLLWSSLDFFIEILEL
jgi:hypothetical protein